MRITEKTIGPWTPELIKAVLITNQEQREKALIKIYNRQTQDEKSAEATKYHNNIGFTGADAMILTSFANQLLTKKYLSEKQQFILTKKIVKYAGQICEEANATWAVKNDINVDLFSGETRIQKIQSLRESYQKRYENVIRDLVNKKRVK